MKNRQDEDARSGTLDEKGEPRTTSSTHEQIEKQKAVRRTGDFPPPPADRDEDVDQEVERESWDRLKAGPRNNPDKPPYDGID